MYPAPWWQKTTGSCSLVLALRGAGETAVSPAAFAAAEAKALLLLLALLLLFVGTPPRW